MLSTIRKLKILDFDIENRPLSYWTPTEPTSEITAIASCWADDPTSMEVLALGLLSPSELLARFLARYNEADIVTGHYIRRHDLPTINGAMVEYGFANLKPKLTIDTWADFVRHKGIPASQEYLMDLFHLETQKYHMTQHDWRTANRLSKNGIAETIERASSDVRGHMQLREYMSERKLLKSPKVWAP